MYRTVPQPWLHFWKKLASFRDKRKGASCRKVEIDPWTLDAETKKGERTFKIR